MDILIAEIVGFILVLAVLYRFVLPLVKTMVAKRQDTVQQQVDDAEEATRKLDAAQQRFESAVAEAHTESARIRDDSRAEAARIREELKEQAEREIERIKQRGEEQLAAQRDQVVRQLRAELGGLSMQLAEQVVVESLSDDGARSITVDRFLDDLDEMPDRDADPAFNGDGADRVAATPAGGGAT